MRVWQLTNPMVTQSVHSPRNLKSLSMPPPAAIVITVLCPSAPIRTIVVVLPLSSLSSPPPEPLLPPPPSTTVVVNMDEEEEEEVSNVVAELTAMDVVVLVSVSSCKLCRKAALTAAQWSYSWLTLKYYYRLLVTLEGQETTYTTPPTVRGEFQGCKSYQFLCHPFCALCQELEVGVGVNVKDVN